jgi:hypothetical protein
VEKDLSSRNVLNSVSWSAPDDPNIDTLVGYNVYMDPNETKVRNATADDPGTLYSSISQTGTSFDPDPDLSDGDTNYYWRVDLIADFDYVPGTDPNTVTGDIWRFTTGPNDFAPIVDAGSSYVTWLGNLPQGLTGTVDDSGEGDVNDPNVVWSITDGPVTAIASVTKTSTDPLAPTADFTTDTVGDYTIELASTDLAMQTGFDTLVVRVAADACEAAQLAGTPLNYFDYDNDCDVDIVDFAAFALQWLDDIKPTASIPY